MNGANERSERSGRSKTSDELRLFNPGRILMPVLLGTLIVGYVMRREFIKQGQMPLEVLAAMNWHGGTFLWLGLAVLMLALREFGYIWQLRNLTDGRLRWRHSLQVVLLWDFFAAVSPSMVGGAAVALFMLSKEGLSLGRSTAIVFTTVFLDQVFYISIPFLVSLIIPQKDIFAPLEWIPSDLLGDSVLALFWSAWGSMAAYVVLLVGALFVAPTWVNWWLTRLFTLPFMHRWRARGLHMANELLIASKDLRGRSTRWWLKVWAATSLAWIGRYLVLNCVLAAFTETPYGFFDQALIAGRQAVLWIIMVVSPTPGSAGLAELGFSWLFRDLVPAGAALSLAIVWRTIAYYPYLIIGVPVMTHWIKRVFGSDLRVQSSDGA